MSGIANGRGPFVDMRRGARGGRVSVCPQSERWSGGEKRRRGKLGRGVNYMSLAPVSKALKRTIKRRG